VPAPAKARSANVMVMRLTNITASIPPDESEPANRSPRMPSLTPVPAGTNTARNPATAIVFLFITEPLLLCFGG
jgi:hypothetical protein